MLADLVCSMAGDVFLALDKEEGVLLGRLLIFAVEVLILCFGNFEFQGFFPVLVGYAAIISFMVIKALSLWKCRLGKERGVCLIMIGSVLFLISDNLLL